MMLSSYNAGDITSIKVERLETADDYLITIESCESLAQITVNDKGMDLLIEQLEAGRSKWNEVKDGAE